MKNRYAVAIFLVVYVLLLWFLNDIWHWIIAGIIAGIASSLHLSTTYARAYAKEEQRIRAEGLTISPEKVVGRKTNTLAFSVIVAVIFGILSFGFDSFLSKMFSIIF